MDDKSYNLPVLTEVSNQKGSALFSVEIFDKIQSILDQFRFAKDVLLEFSLDQSERVDININIWQTEIEALSHSDAFRASPEWVQIIKWTNAWKHEQKPFRTYIPNIWLVFDLVDIGAKQNPAPWLILTLAPVPISQSLNYKMATNALDVFTSVKNDIQLQSLKRAFETCPKNGFIPGICVFEREAITKRRLHSKSEQIIRIGVRSFYNYDEIKDYLQRQVWKGNYEALEHGCKELIPLCSYAMLSLNFDDYLMNTIGIECYFDKKNNTADVKQFLSVLIEKGLCTRQKMIQILEHIRIHQVSESIKFHQWVLEIKLVMDDSDAWKAKVYFLYQRKFTSP